MGIVEATQARQVTLADVARRAGVSSTTASFVLSGRDMGISPATADRVLEAARALGYDHVNRASRRTGRAHARHRLRHRHGRLGPLRRRDDPRRHPGGQRARPRDRHDRHPGPTPPRGRPRARAHRPRRRPVHLRRAVHARYLGWVHCRWWPPQAHVRGSARRWPRPPKRQRPDRRRGDERPCRHGRLPGGRGPPAARPPPPVRSCPSTTRSCPRGCRPACTSIGLPYFEMGRRAVEVLLGATTNDTVVRVHMPLHQRESVAAPRGR